MRATRRRWLLVLAAVALSPFIVGILCCTGTGVQLTSCMKARQERQAELLRTACKAYVDVETKMTEADELLARGEAATAEAKVDEAAQGFANWRELGPTAPCVAEALQLIRDRQSYFALVETTSEALPTDDAGAVARDGLLENRLSSASEMADPFRSRPWTVAAVRAAEAQRKGLAPAVARFRRAEAKEAAEMKARQEAAQRHDAEVADALARCGKGPDEWEMDGGNFYIDEYVARIANDPDSVDSASCSTPVLTDRCWKTTCIVRAKNGFGAMVAESHTFYLGSDGDVLRMD